MSAPDGALERVRRHARGGLNLAPAPAGETVWVSIADRGRPPIEPGLPAVVTLQISTACPVCGMRRGAVTAVTVSDWIPAERRSGPQFTITRWRNPCGHLDVHADVIQEAIGAGTYVRPGQRTA